MQAVYNLPNVMLLVKFYDPWGFLALVTIRFKVFFQRICQDKLEWDVSLPEELVERPGS